jgi:DNA-binding transcriptional ArsR family regulator
VNKTKVRNKVKKILDEYEVDGVHIKEYDQLEIDKIIFPLEEAGLVRFNVEERNSEMDYWYQAEYYSPTIKKVIIIDYDFRYRYESIEDLLTHIEHTEEEIDRIENLMKGGKL